MCNMIGSSKAKSEQDYQAEDDHRTLTRAEEIRADGGRMGRVKKHHAKQSRALKRMDRLMGGRSRR